jgi:hypothetical protein
LDEKIQIINEGVYKARQKSRASNSGYVANKKKKPTIPAPQLKTAISKQYDTRWFVCEACSYVFKVPLKDAPYTIETIPCPECDHAVSAKAYMA